MARRSHDIGEEFIRLIFVLGAIFILAAGGGAAFKKALSGLVVLLLVALGLFVLWLIWRGLRTPTRPRGEALAEYLRSRPYDRVGPDPRVAQPEPAPPPPRSEPHPQPQPRRQPDPQAKSQPESGPKIRVEVPPKDEVRSPDIEGIVAHLRALDWFQF